MFDFRIASKGQPWYSALPRSCSAVALQGECTRSRSVRTSARQIRPLRQSPSLPPRPFFTFRLFEFNGGHAHGELMLTPSFANRVDVLHHQLIHAMETGEISAPHRGSTEGGTPERDLELVSPDLESQNGQGWEHTFFSSVMYLFGCDIHRESVLVTTAAGGVDSRC